MSGFTCSICNVRRETPKDIRDHVLSDEHRRMVEKSNLDHFAAGPTKSPANTTYHCEPCSKRFNGRIPYDDHLASENHLKKVRSKEQTGSNSPAAQDENSLRCEPCGKKFSGQKPYNEHVISEKHIKRVRESSCSGHLSSQSALAMESFCTPCGMRFESSQQLMEHASSQEHRIRLLEITDRGGSVSIPTAEEKEDRNLLIETLAKHTRDFLVCPAETSFMEFVTNHKIFS